MLKTNLDYALFYASKGWPVFPVHTPTDKGCSCRRPECSRIGKHPRITTGRNGATTRDDVIIKWWTVWPNANIGIATGIESGLIVLDVDQGGEESLVGKSLPDTIEQITGSGGRHAIYKRPTDTKIRYKTCVKFLPGLDSRADGGYIVAPPSLHHSGNNYVWEGSSDPSEGIDPVDAPQWLLDAIETRSVDSSLAKLPDWNPDGELPNNIFDMLSVVPSDKYEVWRDVGMALHYTDPADGLDVWNWWSATSLNYDSESVRREWRNFSRRGHKVANPITLSTIYKLAQQHGWDDPDIEHGAAVALNFIESRQRQITEQLHKKKSVSPIITAPSLMPSSGLITDIANYILRTSVRPQPELAVMAALCFIATLAGRKYKTETGLGSNIYAIGIADSGAGKDHARKTISKLAHFADVSHYLGGDRIASGPGAISALTRSPSTLFMIDEFGLMLQAMTGQRADPHKRELLATLMTLYSTAGSVYRGTEYADQKVRSRTDIVNPNAVIYGTSTPGQFYGALTSSQGMDGTLSRLIICPVDNHRPHRQRPQLKRPDTELIESIKSLAAYSPGGGNIKGAGGAFVDTEAQTVLMDPTIYEAWENLDDEMTKYMTDSAAKSVYSRVAENAAKLALVYAISIDHHAPLIGIDAFSWGREIALWAANIMMKEVARYVSDNEYEASVKRIINIISDAGDDGINRRNLLRIVRTIRKRELEDIIVMLIESGQIKIENRKNKRGPATTVYISLG